MTINNKTVKNWIFLILAFFVLIFDQISKLYAMKLLNFGIPLVLFSCLNFTLAHNRGAAFSLFNQGDGWQIIFFTALAIVVSIYLVYWLFSLNNSENINRLGICIILGGTLGNMIDRMTYGYVIDFIDVYYKNFHWPIFNIADSAITIGGTLLIYNYFKHSKQAVSSSFKRS